MSRLLTVLLLVVALVLPASTVYADAGIDSLTNQYRAANGLAPYATDAYLTSTANDRAWQVLDYWKTNGTLDPDPPGEAGGWAHSFYWWDGSGCNAIGENIWLIEANSDASRAMQAWENSPPHNANLLNVSFTRIGSALIHTPEGWTVGVQDFGGDCGGSTAAPAPAQPAPAPAKPAPAPAAPAPSPKTYGVSVLPNTAMPSPSTP